MHPDTWLPDTGDIRLSPLLSSGYPRGYEAPRRMRDVDVRTLARPLPASLAVTA